MCDKKKRQISTMLALSLIFSVLLFPAIPAYGTTSETYLVEKGDTLYEIAEEYDVTVSDILYYNDILDMNMIYTGQTLSIPQFFSEIGTIPVKRETMDSARPVEVIRNEISSNNSADNKISLTIMDTDIRDVLSIFAEILDIQIFYTGDNLVCNYSIADLDAWKAFEYFLKSVPNGGSGLTYIHDEDIYVVGDNAELLNNFFDKMLLYRFNLNYITAYELSSKIDQLQIQAESIMVGDNDNYLWIKANPQNLSEVSQLIRALDRALFFTEDDENRYKANFELVEYKLNYITADIVSSALTQLNVDAQIIRVPSNEMALWVVGTKGSQADIYEVVNNLDVFANRVNEPLESNSLYVYSMQYTTYEEFSSIARAIGIDAIIVGIEDEPSRMIVSCKPSILPEFDLLLDQVDMFNNKDKLIFFVYDLQNTTAAIASQRLTALGLEDLSTNTLIYPQFGKQLFIVCPDDSQEELKELIARVDFVGDILKVPVDSSSLIDGATRLSMKRNLISELTDIPISHMFISSNVATSGDYLYILYVEDTTENIMLVREMVKMIDSPTDGGGSE